MSPGPAVLLDLQSTEASPAVRNERGIGLLHADAQRLHSYFP